jgi:hypothetical protein
MLTNYRNNTKKGENMAVFRVAKVGDFTTMSNHHLRNKKLSLKAVGLMSKILSLPNEWDYSLKGLAKLNTDGIDGVRSAVKELEDAGYIIRRQLRDKDGRMSHSEYLVFEVPELAKPILESPSSENPTAVNPSTGEPLSVNPTQSITNQVITQKENTLYINDPSINHSCTWYGNDETDVMEIRERYKEIIEENIAIAEKGVFLYIITSVGINAVVEMIVAALVTGAAGVALKKARMIQG